MTQNQSQQNKKWWRVIQRIFLPSLILIVGSFGCGENITEENENLDEQCLTPPGVELNSSCGACGSGEWRCEDDQIKCIGDGGDTERNVCGGCTMLQENVGEACGLCDSGTWACNGTDQIHCVEEDTEEQLNICGGCEELEYSVGETCGTCDTGSWVCNEQNGITCEGDLGQEALNQCGECGTPELNECGECGDLILNACGGCQSLDETPGTYCGDCTAAQYICVDEETLICQGSEQCDFILECDFDSDCPSGYCSHGNCTPEEYIFVPRGTFTMGAPPSEPGFHEDRENGQHEVTFTYDFFMKETTVTQGEWYTIMGTNPSYFEHCGDDCPVTTVNWWEMITFANALSQAHGYEQCYNLEDCSDDIGEGCTPQQGTSCQGYSCSTAALEELDLDCTGYRLPTEAEWEYAARAGTQTAFLTDSGELTEWISSTLDPEMDRIAWYRGNSGVTYPGGVDCEGWYEGAETCGIHPVAQKEANNWGFYDMTGNVWEHVWDWSGDYPVPGSSVVDPTGNETGTQRRMRGGPFSVVGQYLRVAYRTGPGPTGRYFNIGFRLVRTVPSAVENDE